MKEMSKFQLALLGIFMVLGIIGLIVVATVKTRNEVVKNEVTLWGTIPADAWDSLKKKLDDDLGAKNFRVKYVAKFPATFDQELLEAIATGNGPDLFLLPQDKILTMRNKVYTIPYDFYPARAFRDTFIQEGELYLTSSGILALPFSVDPLVLYWNRDIFSSVGIAVPPKFWDEFFSLAQRITRREPDGDVTQSAIGIGEFSNVTHAKDIIAGLVLQSGSAIIETTPTGYRAAFVSGADKEETAAVSAARFYTEFSNPVKSTYTWNRAQAPSKEAFLAGNVAMYIGFASELPELRKKNPNLNFDIISLPQVRGGDKTLTFGTMEALAIVKASRFYADAFAAAQVLTGRPAMEIWHTITLLPPVRRDMLTAPPSDAFKTVFYGSALIARAWLDPDPKETNGIFQEMIESITSGRARISDAIHRANLSLGQLLPQYEINTSE